MCSRCSAPKRYSVCNGGGIGKCHEHLPTTIYHCCYKGSSSLGSLLSDILKQADSSLAKGYTRDRIKNRVNLGGPTHVLRQCHTTLLMWFHLQVLVCSLGFSPNTDKQQVAEITNWWPKRQSVLFTTSRIFFVSFFVCLIFYELCFYMFLII